VEDSFAFMNRASHEPWVSLRSLLESWFASYPVEHARDLRGSFRSDAPQQHFAAWWELYLFTLFERLGYLVEVHPPLKHTAKRPDFHLTGDAGSLFVEARLVHSGVVDEEEARHVKREAAMFDLINEAYDPNFHVGVTFERVGTEQPAVREVAEPLLDWLQGLDPDDEAEALQQGREPASCRIVAREWTIVFEALPISPEHRGKPGRLIGLYPIEGGVINDLEKVREALRTKSTRYENFDEPYVIALLCMSSTMSDTDIEGALFGSPAVQYRVNDPEFEPRWVRNQDGFWTRGAQPHGTGVSGVLVGMSLFAWSVHRSLPRLWLNPWGDRPVQGLERLPRRWAEDGGLLRRSDAASSPEAVLVLPAGWAETMEADRD